MIESKQSLNIVFIGGGNMGQALVTGLLDSGWPADNISIVDRDHAMTKKLNDIFPRCHVYTQSEAAINIANVVVLAVKPQVMQSACEQIAADCQIKRPLIISIAAGMLIKNIDHWLGGELPIIRCMPNTPALVQAGISGVYASAEVSDEQKAIADKILSCVGAVCWLDNETLLNAVTAISGSGPAYFFYLIESMIEAGKNMGLTELQAGELAVATAAGAAKLITKTGQSPKDLRLAVTSKGGTTEAAINSMQKNEMQKIVETAIQEAANKSKSLAN
ncbi:MAG: pyrroline-5-carboxylate reductase [Pseudomonadota bacterium]